MAFSLSTLCTDVVLCSALLFLMRIMLRSPSRFGKLGFNWLILNSVLLAIRLLLPFEWGVTKSIPLSQIYPLIFNFWNQPLSLSDSFYFPMYWLLLSIVTLVSLAHAMYLFLAQRKYAKYLNSLPNSVDISYTNKWNCTRRVRCITDPAATNAMAIGLARPQIVMPMISLTEQEKQFIL